MTSRSLPVGYGRWLLPGVLPLVVTLGKTHGVSRLGSWRNKSSGCVTRLSPHPPTRRSTHTARRMSFFPDAISALTERRKEFSEERVLGYTPEMVYDVVADLNNYYHFLPWCKESRYIRESADRSIAKLSVGFPPLTETYTAMVLLKPHRSIRTISTDGNLFSHLENLWQFKKGPHVESGPTCIVGFWVMFEFRSLLYSKFGNLLFDEVARTMAAAFETRCEQIYGPSHLSAHDKRVLRTSLRSVQRGNSELTD